MQLSKLVENNSNAKPCAHGCARFALLISGAGFHQVMSAQASNEAPLRGCEEDRSGEVDSGAVDTGAVLSDAVYAAASGAPQMNGTAGGGTTAGPEEDEEAQRSGRQDGATAAESVDYKVEARTAGTSETQRTQTRTDEGPQRTSCVEIRREFILRTMVDLDRVFSLLRDLPEAPMCRARVLDLLGRGLDGSPRSVTCSRRLPRRGSQARYLRHRDREDC